MEFKFRQDERVSFKFVTGFEGTGIITGFHGSTTDVNCGVGDYIIKMDCTVKGYPFDCITVRSSDITSLEKDV